MSQLIASQVTGTGEPVVLLNGGMMTMIQWEPIALGLAGAFTVVRCDFRGQLMSPGEPEPSLAAHAADVIALLDSLHLRSAHLVGTSFGAFVGLTLAAREPARVRSVAAIAATDVFDEQDWQRGLPVLEACRAAAAKTGDGIKVWDLLAAATFTPEFLEQNRAMIDARRGMVSLLPPIYFAGHARIMETLHNLDLRSDLAKITCPVLVVVGERDLMFPPDRARRLVSAVTGARLEIVPGAPHGIVVEQPDKVVPLLKTFLSGR